VEACADIFCNSTSGFGAAVQAANAAHVAILILGINQQIEAEGLDRCSGFPCNGVNKSAVLGLPGCQYPLIEAIAATGKPIVEVLLNGGPISVGAEATSNSVGAIVDVFYPGALGGIAVADVLFGNYNPGGRLPYTIFQSVNNLANFTNYNVTLSPGRTYRYYDGPAPIYQFGYGLSYTTFEYSDLSLSTNTLPAGNTLTASVVIQNTGSVYGDEVGQVYVQVPQQSYPVPGWALKGFNRIGLLPGANLTVSFELTPYLLSTVDTSGNRYVQPGSYQIFAGGQQPNSNNGVMGKFQITGNAFPVNRI